MYLSHAVRALRDDPIPGEQVTLIVRVGADSDVEAVRAAARGVGADPLGTTEFDAVRVGVSQTGVGALLEELPDGVDAVETNAVTGYGGDAGEDL